MKRYEFSVGKKKEPEPKAEPRKRQKCPNCEGTGKIGKSDCIACQGYGTRTF